VEGDVCLYLLIGDQQRLSKLLDQFFFAVGVQSIAATLMYLVLHELRSKFYTLKPEKHINIHII